MSLHSSIFPLKEILRAAPADCKCPPLTCTALDQWSGQVWNYALANKWHAMTSLQGIDLPEAFDTIDLDNYLYKFWLTQPIPLVPFNTNALCYNLQWIYPRPLDTGDCNNHLYILLWLISLSDSFYTSSQTWIDPSEAFGTTGHNTCNCFYTHEFFYLSPLTHKTIFYVTKYHWPFWGIWYLRSQ